MVCGSQTQNRLVAAVALMVLLAVVPQAEATRDTAYEYAGIHQGYRMLDDAEPDGPQYGAYGDIEVQDYSYHTSPQAVPLLIPVVGAACADVEAWVAGGGIRLGNCGLSVSVNHDAADPFSYRVAVGWDSRGVVANVIEILAYDFVSDNEHVFGGSFTLAVDGTIELHTHVTTASDWYAYFDRYSNVLQRERLVYDDLVAGGAVRWDPLGSLETMYQDVDQTLPGMALPLTAPPVGTPGVPGQSLGPYQVDPVPVGFEDMTIDRMCVPSGLLCAGPIPIPGQSFGETPGVGPVGPFETPGFEEGDEVRVDLEIGLSDLHIEASNRPHGASVHLEVPVIGGVPVTVCAQGCPLAASTELALSGSVFVRGTVAGEPVDLEVPFGDAS